MTKQNLTNKQSKDKTLVTLGSTAGLAAFMAVYSGTVLKKSGLSSAFTLLTGAMVFLTARFTQEDVDG